MENSIAIKEKKGWRDGIYVVPARKLPLTALLSLLTGFGFTLAGILITTQSLHAVLQQIACSPLRVLATTLFLGLLVLALALVTTSLFAGAAAVGVVVLAAALVNYFKMLITSTPLLLSDLGLIGKVGEITRLNSASIHFSRNTLLAIGAVAVWLLVLLWLSKALRLELWWKSAVWALLPIALFALLFCARPVVDAWCFTPLDDPLELSFGQAYNNEKCGLPLGLWHSFLYRSEKMVLTEEERQQALDDAKEYVESVPAGGGSDTQPNVIMILSESFFDVTELPGVTYDSDPLADFHRAQAEGVSGKFYTRTLGYGTCNIELEVLTGINNRFLGSDEQLCYWDGERFDILSTVPELFQSSGYYTAFLHTFDDSIYHRTPIYQHLGFDDLYFSGDFAAIDPKAAAAGDYWAYMSQKIAGGFYSDDYMGELLIDVAKEKTQPVFLYAATMENHTPYAAEKYESYDYAFTAQVSDEARGVLRAVTQGTADASAMLGKLMNYFSESDEPTVIVFFGDHRPGLPLEGCGTVYSALGMCSEDTVDWTTQQTAQLYSTDYVIWANDPNLLPGQPGERRDTSSAFLGLAALRAADLPLDDYWRMIAAVDGDITAYNWHFFVSDTDGVSQTLPRDTDAETKRLLTVMTYLMQQAMGGEDPPEFYELD